MTYSKMELVTKSDTVEIPYSGTTGTVRGFYVTGTDLSTKVTLKIVDEIGNTITEGFPPFSYNPISIKQVFSTGSDAVNVYALR